jgi:hypothetical protein
MRHSHGGGAHGTLLTNLAAIRGPDGTTQSLWTEWQPRTQRDLKNQTTHAVQTPKGAAGGHAAQHALSFPLESESNRWKASRRRGKRGPKNTFIRLTTSPEAGGATTSLAMAVTPDTRAGTGGGDGHLRGTHGACPAPVTSSVVPAPHTKDMICTHNQREYGRQALRVNVTPSPTYRIHLFRRQCVRANEGQQKGAPVNSVGIAHTGTGSR